jgi:RNA polymerase sigma-70 factor (ECF subfamily)
MSEKPPSDAARDEIHLRHLRVARADGDEIRARRALAQLLEPYWEQTRTIAYGRLAGVPDRGSNASRITQDVMERVLKALKKSLDFDGPFFALVARNREWAIIDFWRDQYGEEAVAHDPRRLPEHASAGMPQSSLVEQAHEFEPYLAGLTQRERELVIERILLDMSPEQIAEKHGMSRQAVDTAYHRALEKLRKNRPRPDVRKEDEGAA